TDLSVLSIYGENDGVMNREKYEKNKKNLPNNTTEFIIEGGNHAFFGMYGHQIGDGEATVSQEEQIEMTSEKIASFLVKNQ
ncbi:MAG: lysophospholipase, partial [Clostridia bacterium]|nr:lysophospholipase [Clostridia bacterium]